jgi:hypothetical protein
MPNVPVERVVWPAVAHRFPAFEAVPAIARQMRVSSLRFDTVAVASAPR